MTSEKATNVAASKSKHELTVNWDDGHVSRYSFGLLRAACPCAQCRGGHQNMKAEPDDEVFTRHMDDSPPTRLSNVVAVGSYALTMVWEDGHDYGIYNWHYLRALCPCEECRPQPQS